MKTAYIYRKPGTVRGPWYEKAIVYGMESIKRLPYGARMIICQSGKELFVPPGYTITTKQPKRHFIPS